uniref:Uncharacterized protein n=1 Tax=Pipistrellus kuhlii TaxID=59472 RepID=A0A7J7UTI1_PIPKU|nr:hypothetical protein mPipKuh1_008694 [Pipistrellus kuhlii]
METAQWLSGVGWVGRQREECSGAERCQGFGWLESGSHLQRAAHTSTEGLEQQLRARGSSLCPSRQPSGAPHPPPRGHSPVTHGPLLRGLVGHAQPTRSSTPGQISNNDLGARGLCHMARDYPRNRGLRVGLGEPEALKLFVSRCGKGSGLVSVCITLTFWNGKQIPVQQETRCSEGFCLECLNRSWWPNPVWLSG